jgi:HlyD family secretion protein
MKAVHYIIVIAILILGVLCYLIKKEADLKTSRYSFVHPEKRNIYQTLIISGILLPKEETKIKSSISGVIEKMFIEVGDVVSQGDPLFQIQSMVDPFQLKKIENTFLLTKNIYENQQAIYDRMLELHTKNMINDDEYQRSRNDYIKAKYDFETSKSEYFFVTNNHSNKELSKLNEIK